MTESELKNKVATLLGGRAAEELIYDEVSTGAHDDLSKATDIARSMVKTFGMSPRVGQVSFEKDRRALHAADTERDRRCAATTASRPRARSTTRSAASSTSSASAPPRSWRGGTRCCCARRRSCWPRRRSPARSCATCSPRTTPPEAEAERPRPPTFTPM